MGHAARIPVTIVTGFLGSGKTTLIAEVLRQPGFDGTLVVVNEFGEVGIDHDLLEASSEDVILLANGCLCCTIRGNLIDTLVSAMTQVKDGRLRPFDRVVVETSGLADPAPFLGFLYQEAEFHDLFTVAGIVTVCDGVDGADTLTRFPEAVSQVRMADRLIISKGDVADAAALARLEAELRQLNPDAALQRVVRGAIDAARILDPAGIPDHGRVAEVAGTEAPHGHHHHHHDDPNDAALRHHGIRRLAFAFPRLDPAQLEALVAALRNAATPALLRVKGLLRLGADAGVAVVQGAMGRIAPPDLLGHQVAGEGRLVCLVQGDEAAAAIAAALTPLGAVPFRA